MKGMYLAFFIFFRILGFSFSESEYKVFVEEKAKEFIKKNNAAGLAIAIYKETLDRDKPYEKTFCFGQARRSRKINVSESTLFRLGPLGKLFTVFLLLKYEHLGKLKLEDLVDKYFPKTFVLPSYNTVKPTLKDVALELSALPSMPALSLKASQISEIEVKSFFKNHKLLRAPGKKYEPSDLGYACLIYLLSRQAKNSYPDMLRQEILGPLGMLETDAYIPFSKTYKLALGHKGISEVGELFYQKDGSFLKGVLGWSSTIEDMQKLLSFLLGKKIANLESIKPRLFKIEYVFPQNPANKLSFGLRAEPLSTQQQVSYFYQHISYQGYDHFLGVIPSMGAGLVILSNSEYSVADLAKQLLEEFFK